MGTGAESPGLSCPLDVDLFPAYSDDSPLCVCLFVSLEFGERFHFLLFASKQYGFQGCAYPDHFFFPAARKAGPYGHYNVRIVGVFLGICTSSFYFLSQCICYRGHCLALPSFIVHGDDMVDWRNMQVRVSLHGGLLGWFTHVWFHFQGFIYTIDAHEAPCRVRAGCCSVFTAYGLFGIRVSPTSPSQLLRLCTQRPF